MPLVVSALRLMMLFLNVYDSYKTLKPPPPSRRNGGQPSQRALSQRKRDMKGCLAVWIVWCCFIKYERMAEVVISLFVPFYDEFKSMVLLFLIFTRARGAEPIFLHVLRPLLKPYTPTLDLLLDFVRMIGDILCTMVKIPVNFALTWWRSLGFCADGVVESDADGSRESDEGTSSFLSHNKHAPIQVPLFQEKQPDRNTRTSQPAPSNNTAPTLRTHQIWYPPPSSYSDDEHDATPRPVNGAADPPAVQSDIASVSEEVMREQEAWRQYPAFPSAYPPTPMIYSVSGLPTTTGTVPPPILPPVLEDSSQQDFRGSLLPPRKHLNPSLSDEYTPRVQSNDSEDMSVDSDSEEGEDEDEDDFNVTLKTPMPRSDVGTLIQLDRETSRATSISSRSTTLSTTDNESSLRTQSSSESLSSAAMSLPDLTSPLGKKRPLPSDSTIRAKRTSRLLEPSQTSRVTATKSVDAVFQHSNDGDSESKTSSTDLDSNQKPAHPKRRKIVAPPVRPTRPQATRHATVLSNTQINAFDVQTYSRGHKELIEGKNHSTGPNGSSQIRPKSSKTSIRPGVTLKPRPLSQREKQGENMSG